MTDSKIPSAPQKLLNIGDVVYQFTWNNFEGTVFERVVEAVTYTEWAKPEDCFYRYHLKGFTFNNENSISNRQRGGKWFASREEAKTAMDAEITKCKADYAADLKKEIDKSQAKLNFLSVQ